MLSTLFRSLMGLCLLPTYLYAQPDTAIQRVQVPLTLLRQHVYALAADSLKGRKTGTEGQEKAALYCTKSFRLCHLQAAFRLDTAKGSFRQPFFVSTSAVVPYGSIRSNTGARIRIYSELTPVTPGASTNSRTTTGFNIGGFAIGTDLKRDVIVLSAHYDHLGKSGKIIYPGADDNASGTATVLSIAATVDSLAQLGIRPRRSILFLLFSGEEEGLLGSQYFVLNCPVSLTQIRCAVNVDMLGRIDDWHRKKPDYCYVISGNQDVRFRKTAESANKRSVTINLDFQYDTSNDPNQYFYRSDQYSFAKFNVPVLFFMSGEHSDYHKPSDTADKIAYDVLQKRATVVFQTVWQLANEAP